MNGVGGPRPETGTAVGVDGLALAATVAVVAGAPAFLRTALVLSFVLIGPGAAVAALLGVRGAAHWATVTLGGSIAAGVLISSAAAVAGWWHPTVQPALLAALSAAGATAAWWRSRGLAHRHEGERPCMSS